MNEEILNNIWNQLTSDGLTQSSFEDWSVNIQSSPEVQQNIHNYLFEQGLTQNDFDSWATNTGLKKKKRPIWFQNRSVVYRCCQVARRCQGRYRKNS